MSCIKTTTVTTPEQQAEERGRRLDTQFEWLQKFVCEKGPLLLTVGMPVEEANEAIIACIVRLDLQRMEAKVKLAIAERIIDALHDYNVGESFLSEEKVQAMMKEWHHAADR